MKNPLEPKSLLDVRKWKERASREIEKYGMEAVGKRAFAKLDRLKASEGGKKRVRLQGA
jgi:hypothetical protein